jgi:hypothetical protein
MPDTDDQDAAFLNPVRDDIGWEDELACVAGLLSGPADVRVRGKVVDRSSNVNQDPLCDGFGSSFC